MTARIAILAALLAAPVAAQQVGTCASPGPCPDYPIETEHLKRIECGPWPDGLYVRAEVPLSIVPLAGEQGYSRAEQCEMLRSAITGVPQ
jgi:hypothetical protein